METLLLATFILYCPDGVTCAQNCALNGADYEGTYGSGEGLGTGNESLG